MCQMPELSMVLFVLGPEKLSPALARSLIPQGLILGGQSRNEHPSHSVMFARLSFISRLSVVHINERHSTVVSFNLVREDTVGHNISLRPTFFSPEACKLFL